MKPILPVLAALLAATPALAQNAAQIDHARRGASCPRCNLFQADFGGAELKGRNFAGARLRQANLSVSVMNHTNFSGADLRDADASAAVFSSSNFAGADLTNATFVGTYLQGANFHGARMNGTNFPAPRWITQWASPKASSTAPAATATPTCRAACAFSPAVKKWTY